MNFKSIKFKLIFYYFFIFSIVFLLFSFFIYNQFHKLIINEIDKSNYTKLREIEEILEKSTIEKLEDIKSGHLEEEELDMLYSKHFLQIYTKNKKLLLKSKNLGNESLPLPQIIPKKGVEQTIEMEDEKLDNIRVLTIYSENKKYIIQIGSSLNLIGYSIKKVFYLILFFFPLVTFVSLLVGIFLTNTAFQPVKTIIKTANKIQSENLSSRLREPKTGDEIEELSKTINTMLGRLDDSFKEIKEFSARASHELRTPLTIVRGVAEVALRKERNKDEYKEVLKNILEEVKNLQKIIDSLLTLSRLDASHFNKNSQIINLTNLLDLIYKQSLILAESKKISVLFNKPDRIIEIRGDEVKLKEMFLNLISNAIKYTQENGQIQIKTFIEKNDVTISIKDSGIGISEKDLPHIFEPFYKGERADKKSLGIGLSIVKKIVEYHQGTIHINSTLNKGSLIFLKFPLKSISDYQQK